MSKYELQIARAEYCIDMASKQTDERLITFWCNASAGFRTRAEKLEVGQV